LGLQHWIVQGVCRDFDVGGRGAEVAVAVLRHAARGRPVSAFRSPWRVGPILAFLSSTAAPFPHSLAIIIAILNLHFDGVNRQW
jgi:hypothetical protein